jgi:hypothetical protein
MRWVLLTVVWVWIIKAEISHSEEKETIKLSDGTVKETRTFRKTYNPTKQSTYTYEDGRTVAYEGFTAYNKKIEEDPRVGGVCRGPDFHKSDDTPPLYDEFYSVLGISFLPMVFLMVVFCTMDYMRTQRLMTNESEKSDNAPEEESSEGPAVRFFKSHAPNVALCQNKKVFCWHCECELKDKTCPECNQVYTKVLELNYKLKDL